MHLTFGGQLPSEDAQFFRKVALADRMHWTLDYVESLDVVEYQRVVACLDAWDSAKAHLQRRSTNGKGKGKR